MKSPRSQPASRTKPRTPRADGVSRLDGVGHWAKGFDQHVWMLARAGIPADQILRQTMRSLKRHQRVAALQVPSARELEYSRVLTQWTTDPSFLGKNGRPLALATTGRSASFAVLVKKALADANPNDVLDILQQHGMVQRKADGRVELLARTFLPHGKPQAQFVAYGLNAVEAMMATLYATLGSAKPQQQMGQFLRFTLAERYDMTPINVKDFDDYARGAATDFLHEQDQFLKRREYKGSNPPKGRVGYAGLCTFAFVVKPRRTS